MTTRREGEVRLGEVVGIAAADGRLPDGTRAAVLGVPEAILAEAGLSFLGFGVQPPQATWGNIIADGKTYILDAWWLILFPGLAILLAALSFYLTGDALRQAVETRSERQ